MTAEYTIAALSVSAAVTVLELTVFRTGIFRLPRYWATLTVLLAFQIPVDGLLTGGSAPVVSYRDAATSGLRLPSDIPIEDFGFGFALITLTLVLWQWHRRRESADDA
jgi:lycopene cyclase domain-containing protein